MVGNHVAEIVSRYGADGAAVPQALTDYIAGREGYDYNEHGRAGNTHTQFVPDEIIDRFCLIGPPVGADRAPPRARGPRRRPVRPLPPARRQGRDARRVRHARHPGRERARGRADLAQTTRPGHMRRRAHVSQAGRRAWHVRRPWRRRLTWSSSSAPGRRRAEHLRRAARRSPRPRGRGRDASRRARRACRPGCRACRRRTAGRTPRSCARRRAASTGSRGPRRRRRRGSQSSESSPRSEIASRIAWMRTDFTFEMPPGRIASSTSSTGASRTASQVSKRSRRRR